MDAGVIFSKCVVVEDQNVVTLPHKLVICFFTKELEA